GIPGADRRVSEREERRVVPGGARQPGSVAPHPALPAAPHAARPGAQLRGTRFFGLARGGLPAAAQRAAEGAGRRGIELRRGIQERSGVGKPRRDTTMQVEVKVPQLSESVSEATLVAWRKKAGEPVKRDENLIDIETDKVVLELPAPADGVLAKIIKNDGESVTSGEVIAVLDAEAVATAAPKA